MARLLQQNLVSITLSSLLSGIGMGLVGVFVPLLLLGRGLQLWQVCAFYAVYALAKVMVNYPSARLINRYGARLGLMVGYGAMAAFMLLLAWYLARGDRLALGLMVPAMAVRNSFCWNSQHLHISRVMDGARKSRDLALMTNLGQLAGMATPVIGGLIALHSGTVWLTVVATIFIAAAIVPVWRMDRLAGGHKVATDLAYNLRQAPPRDLLANFAFNAHTLVGVMVWPVYLAVFVPHIAKIGVIATASSLAAAIVLQITARRADRGRSFQVLLEGTAASSVVHIGRVLASSNPFTITLISALYDIALSYQQNPWTSIYYAHARHGGINYIMSMEIAGDLAYVIVWSVLCAVAYAVRGTIFFTVAFALAAALAWLCLLITKERPNAAQAG